MTNEVVSPPPSHVSRLTSYCCYRHRLFKPSEPFITQQAEVLGRYRAVYAGWSMEGEAPDGAAVHTLNALSRVALARSSLLRDGRALARVLAPHQPALLHAHFGYEGVYALDVAQRLRIPLVTTFHGSDATLSPWALIRTRLPSRLNYLAFRRRLAREGDLFICVSEFIREKVLDLGFPPERTVVHYIGVDVEGMDGPRSATRVPCTPHQGAGGGMVLHVARLVEKKGTRYLLEAFVRAAGAGANARLEIIGDGPLRGPLEAYAQSLGIAERVTFRGAQPHDAVVEAIRSAQLVCLPSVTAASGDSEGLAMVVLEAAALGRPVVSSHHGGIPEAVEDGKTGYLVPERDVATLADRLAALLQDGELAGRMGGLARARVLEQFNLVKQSKKLEGIFDAVRRKK